jgi:hypothetical protein
MMNAFISPPLTLESSALFTPRVSKMKPSDAPSYYARLLVSTAAMKQGAWKALETAVHQLGKEHFGPDYAKLAKGGNFRSPIRQDVFGKGWPDDIEAFLNVKSGADYKPVVVGRDAMPIMDQAEIYPGCVVRVSLRLYAYGGKGTSFNPGISFGLNNLQKLSDGPRLATARGDGSEFGKLPDDDDLASLLS